MKKEVVNWLLEKLADDFVREMDESSFRVNGA